MELLQLRERAEGADAVDGNCRVHSLEDRDVGKREVLIDRGEGRGSEMYKSKCWKLVERCKFCCANLAVAPLLSAHVAVVVLVKKRLFVVIAKARVSDMGRWKQSPGPIQRPCCMLRC